MWSREAGRRCLRSSKNEWMPCRHILAGMEYFEANRRRARLAEGCWLARKKSWCSCNKVRCKAIKACHCSLFSLGWEVGSACAKVACLPSTSIQRASTMTSPAYIPFTSATSCSCEMGLVSGCKMNSLVSSVDWPRWGLLGEGNVLEKEESCGTFWLRDWGLILWAGFDFPSGGSLCACCRLFCAWIEAMLEGATAGREMGVFWSGVQSCFPLTFGRDESNSEEAPWGAEFGLFLCGRLWGCNSGDCSLKGDADPAEMPSPVARRLRGVCLSSSDASCMVTSSLPRGVPRFKAPMAESVCVRGSGSGKLYGRFEGPAGGGGSGWALFASFKTGFLGCESLVGLRGDMLAGSGYKSGKAAMLGEAWESRNALLTSSGLIHSRTTAWRRAEFLRPLLAELDLSGRHGRGRGGHRRWGGSFCRDTARTRRIMWFLCFDAGDGSISGRCRVVVAL